ncbi:MAG: hypothetical protein Kow0069_16930 [Promethearchaeota archaeon]
MGVGLFDWLTNRRTWLAVGLVAFASGAALVAVGALRPDENFPARISFPTSPAYRQRLNDFFNRTDATPREDAANKLVEDYDVAGFVLVPLRPAPPGGYPAVVWMHGFGVSAELQLNFPRQFAKSGFLTLAISQPGHGWSGGLWDMGVQTLLGVYSAVDWLVNRSPWADLVDPTRVGVAGHSMGGIATTRAAIFDDWTDPTSGLPVGTGGAIRASAAVYCWDDLETMAEGLVEGFLGVEDAWNHPTITDVLDHWRWLANYDASVVPEEVRVRSVTNFLSAQVPGGTPRNYLLVTGIDDELTTPAAQARLVANATLGLSDGAPANWVEVLDAVATRDNHTWDWPPGSFDRGTARRLVLVPGVEHLEEAFSHRVVRNVTSWFAAAMDCGNIVDAEVAGGPVAWELPFLVGMLGWALALGAVPLLVIATLRVALPTPPTGQRGETPSAVGTPLGVRKLAAACFAATAAPVAAVGPLRLRSATHYWILDLLVPRVALAGAACSAAALVTWWWWRRRRRRRRGSGGPDNCPPNSKTTLLVPLVVAGWVAAFDALAFAFNAPLALPRPLTATSVSDFAALAGVLALGAFGVELAWRGTFQPALDAARAARGDAGRFGLYARSAALSGASLGLGAAANLSFWVGGLLLEAPWTLLALFGGLPLLFFLLGLPSAWVAHRTGRWGPAVALQVALLATFLGGKLFLPYA